MNLRDNVLIQPNAIASIDLESLLALVQQAETSPSLVSNFADETPDDQLEWVVNKNIRDTQEVHLSNATRKQLSAIDDTCVLAFINPYYKVEVRDREPSQILHYGVGGHYIPHVDSETLYKDELGIDIWEKTLDRDLSVVYFLNDDFSGGELVFPDLDLVIKPKAGTLVCFPSDHYYIHGVNPVTSGNRYTIVNWMRVKGIPTMKEINEMTMGDYHRMRPRQFVQRSWIAKGG